MPHWSLIVDVCHQHHLIHRDDLCVAQLVICKVRNRDSEQFRSTFTATELIVVLCGLFPTPEALVFTGFCGIASHFLCPLDALYFRHQQTAMRILTLSVSYRRKK